MAASSALGPNGPRVQILGIRGDVPGFRDRMGAGSRNSRRVDVGIGATGGSNGDGDRSGLGRVALALTYCGCGY